MLDFSMGEIGLIAAVALVVLGPDKLPQVAKTAGSLMGRAQRFVSQVKSDIDKEVQLSELKKIQEDAKKMAADLQSNMQNTASQLESQIKEISTPVQNAGAEIKSQMDSASQSMRDSWMQSTAPKSDLSMESIVEAPSQSEEDKPEDPAEWDNLPFEMDTDSLERAYNWPDGSHINPDHIEATQSSVPEELQGDAPLYGDVLAENGVPQSRASAGAADAQLLSDLMREVALLKEQMAQQSGRAFSARSASRAAARGRAPLRAGVRTFAPKGRFTPYSHTNKPRISRIST